MKVVKHPFTHEKNRNKKVGLIYVFFCYYFQQANAWMEDK